jgi:hypothetical protein
MNAEDARTKLIALILVGDRMEAVDLLDERASRCHWRPPIIEVLAPALEMDRHGLSGRVRCDTRLIPVPEQTLHESAEFFDMPMKIVAFSLGPLRRSVRLAVEALKSGVVHES